MERIEYGRCFCGSIRTELKGEPFWICYDHDDDCRRATGAALNVWVGYRPVQVRSVCGQPTSFSKTSGVIRTFCGSCGTSISYVDQALPDEIYVALGFLDRPQAFPPCAHAYFREHLSWLTIEDDLPKFDGYSRSRDADSGFTIDRR